MAKDPEPEEAGGAAADEAESLIARSRQPELGRQADRALGALARKIRTLRDEGGDAQRTKDLGAALRRVRAEITRRAEEADEDGAAVPDAASVGAATGAAGARAPRSPGIRAGRPGARKVPKPKNGKAARDPAEPVRAPKVGRPEAGGGAEAATARRTAGMTPDPSPKADAAREEDKAEKKARKEAEKAERKRVKEAEKAEEKAAKKALKEAEKAEKAAKKAAKPASDAPEG